MNTSRMVWTVCVMAALAFASLGASGCTSQGGSMDSSSSSSGNSGSGSGGY
ncbi:hypothetical protein [Paraburkholderia sp.]|uniref:hypothetical protein n=1 Tax=Paraburkholderia sp. TaxID=1926495 RepID=UPI00239C24FE|nr:hypothetical protein [Paraburkholderia sp.]MDE1184652.1 hypothetical protein [Paraburkholderia sp.]